MRSSFLIYGRMSYLLHGISKHRTITKYIFVTISKYFPTIDTPNDKKGSYIQCSSMISTSSSSTNVEPIGGARVLPLTIPILRTRDVGCKSGRVTISLLT